MLRFLALATALLPIPSGTTLHLRLRTPVIAATARDHAPLEAVLTVPVLLNGRIAIPAGATVSGEIRDPKPAAKTTDRASLRLVFDHIEATALHARLASIDNARETLDSDGTVRGILASETLSARMDQGIERVSKRYPALGEILASIKGEMVQEADPDIRFDRGTDLTVTLTAPLAWNAPPTAPAIPAIPDAEALADLANRQPFRSRAIKPPSPSDLTNLMFLGTREQIEAAFESAGWTRADALTSESKMETVRAVAEMRGYKEAPVSLLTLDGRAPDLTFQKQTNTFAKRHHLRIWSRPATFDGRPVWLCAATHDIGIDFSQEARTFTHQIDPHIDDERAKVVNDLLFTARVKGLALVDRPKVPRQSQNATGDELITDGRIAVLAF